MITWLTLAILLSDPRTWCCYWAGKRHVGLQEELWSSRPQTPSLRHIAAITRILVILYSLLRYYQEHGELGSYLTILRLYPSLIIWLTSIHIHHQQRLLIVITNHDQLLLSTIFCHYENHRRRRHQPSLTIIPYWALWTIINHYIPCLIDYPL